jgi:hypothetical protein
MYLLIEHAAETDGVQSNAPLYYMAIRERSLDPNPADGAGLVAHAQALLRFTVGLGRGRQLNPQKEHISAERRKTTPSNGDRTEEGITCRRVSD